MKKILVVSILLAFAAAPAYATQCWNLAPFIDNIEVEIADSTNGKYLLHGKWVANSYHIPIVGEANKDAAGDFRMGYHGTNNTSSFAGWKSCVIDATMDATLNGTYTIECGGAGGFVNSGTLVPIACPITLSPTDADDDRKSAGEN